MKVPVTIASQAFFPAVKMFIGQVLVKKILFDVDIFGLQKNNFKKYGKKETFRPKIS